MSTSAITAAASSVDGLAAQVRQAHDERRPVRIIGSGTWKSCGTVDASTTINTNTLDEILDYVPGDLTMTVGAGVTLSAIERATAPHGQWLTLDPYGSPDGTIGATIASASSGPLATAFGTPRDIVLGIEAVTGTGSVIRAGGRVVKNVAGFDLSRLFTGSRGTLGAITEVSLRLRGRPAVDETIAIAIAPKPSAIRDIANALRGWPATPMAAELLDAGAASVLGLHSAATLLIRFGGNARSVAAQRKRAVALGKSAVVESGIWERVRAIDLDAAVSYRIADAPTAFIERWDDATALCADGGRAIGSVLRGQIRCMLPAIDRPAFNSFRSRAKTASIVFDSLPTAAMWNALTMIPEEASLNARVKDAFDPAGIMNPGAMRLAR